MGCAGSKLDDLPAVALCKERCSFLDEAIRHRFELADSHLAYLHSLQRLALSFHCFFIDPAATLNVPPQRKGHPAPPSSSPPTVKKSAGRVSFHSHSRSNSGSHLHFLSDDDDDDDDDISHIHSHVSSPLQRGMDLDSIYAADRNPVATFLPGPGTGGGEGFFHMNYMKSSKTTPSIIYEQRPVTSESILHFSPGDPSSSSYPYNYNNYGSPGSNTNPYPYSGYSNYGASGGYYGYSASTQPQVAGPGTEASSSSKPPPPPPSPARQSAWDFLNLFESSERYYPPYVNTPSRNSKDVREEEGIPDLEDEEGVNNNHGYYQNEVVKEVLHGGEQPRYNASKSVMTMGGGDEGEMASSSTFYNQARPSVAIEKDVAVGGGGGGGPVDYEVYMVDKKVVDGDGGSEEGNNIKVRKSAPRVPTEVAFEIKAQFERASASGDQVAKLLAAGRLPHSRKHASKVLHGVNSLLPVVSSQLSTSKGAADASSSVADKTGQLLEIDEELAVRSKNLSSTLQKLYLLEKKLYIEVKAEEKMRVAHKKNCRKLKRLDERGAEAQKVESTRNLIRSLSTNMRMAIQVVDNLSVTINKIRDEELWPQLNELIQGLTRMWKSMLECHRSQCEVIRGARSLGPIGLSKHPSYAHLEAAHDLVNWMSAFSCWIGAQKGYVKALNNWLMKCLLYEPEETPDGIVPFSPGRIGAPPVFVICNQWAQAMDRISEKEVIEAMSAFAISVLQLCERDYMETHQRMVTNKDLERKVRTFDREDQKIPKEIQALEKQIVRVAGDGNGLSVTSNILFQSDTSKNLQGNPQRIFEAMERFMSDSMKVYEELVQRSEEETLAREHDRVL